MPVKNKCEHLVADTWHVPTREAREMVRLPPERRYGWRDQLRAESSGGASRWMFPGLLALAAAGVVIGDWWLILGSIAALSFFLYQAATLVRALGSGRVVTTTSRELTKVEADGKDPVYRAVTQLGQRRLEVIVTCQQCIEALQQEATLELAVLIDPADAGNNWLVGFRGQ